MSSLDNLRDTLNVDNHLFWLFIATAVATLVTLQTIESAMESAWPHMRRASTMAPGQRRAVPIWGIVGLLVLPGALLALMTLGVMLWRDVESSRMQEIGAILLAAGWIIFLLANLNWLGIGRLLNETGVIGPLAIGAVLVAANLLLLIGFVDIVPEFSEVADAIKDLLPFV